ncbi:ATP-binding protein [Streptomyces gobiensis]|uniref:ATP-binding protein n=1 Tax=Streptomyces gobiensis TaxID=2875706 RepID=UPI001E396F2D|nr:ATP-binding protein [Streptomyces gobiensis]UGY93474.1 ATP-binding protein [Streptomyces gobiensis]
MSLTRRIAKSALLSAAGAVSVVGAAAGSANAVDVPPAPQLGGLGALETVEKADGDQLGNTVDETAQTTSVVAGEVGSEVVRHGVPAAGQVAGSLGKSALPLVQEAAGEANVSNLPGKAVRTVTENLSVDGLPTDVADAVPTDAVGTASLGQGGGTVAGIPL